LTEQRVKETGFEMPTAEAHPGATEQELVERWRADELVRAGYPAEVAAELARRSDIDLHRAAELLARGCPLDLAVEILR